jgi:Cu(I)/Ag(I) efflux system membrane fusion protein
VKPGLNWRLRVAAGAAAGVVVVLGGLLLLQDYRHGWPFSRHHATPEARATQPAPAANTGQVARAAARSPVEVDSARLEALGVRFEPVTVEVIAQPARAVATVVADEARISHVHTRVSGWLEQLFVNTTGQPVRAGEPLAAVFSQELYASQNEYLSLLRLAQDAPRTAALEAGRTRLELLSMTAAEIAEIERTGQARRLVTIVSPHGGVVLRRGVSVGTAIDPSTEIVTVADLSTVWVLAEVPQSDAARLAQGAAATLSFPDSGRVPFMARVAFVYPTLTERTRTVRVRFAVANADARLRPGLYGTAEFSGTRREALTVSRDAIVDTGESQYAYVRSPAGLLDPREVKVGARVVERVEVTQGLSASEEVVATGVFLIDSESRLRASGGGAGHSGHSAAPAREPPSALDRKQEVAPPAHKPGHGG